MEAEMAFEPTKADQEALDKFLGAMLDAYRAGRADRLRVIGVLAHAITAAALDNQGEFEKYIRLTEARHLH
jgi:hypothetical protein